MNTTVILYPTTDGIAIIRPVDPTISVLEIARGMTPAGVPFIFVDENELPDFEYFDAWTADFSNPDGYGIGLEAWANAQQNQSNTVEFTPSAEILAAAEENETQ